MKVHPTILTFLGSSLLAASLTSFVTLISGCGSSVSNPLELNKGAPKSKFSNSTLSLGGCYSEGHGVSSCLEKSGSESSSFNFEQSCNMHNQTSPDVAMTYTYRPNGCEIDPTATGYCLWIETLVTEDKAEEYQNVLVFYAPVKESDAKTKCNSIPKGIFTKSAPKF